MLLKLKLLRFRAFYEKRSKEGIMFLFTKDFWTYAFERAVKTIAQAAIALITAEAFGLFNGEAWINVASVAGMAGVVSILMSLTAYSAVNNDADMKALEATVNRMTHKAQIVEASAQTIKSTATEVTTSPDAKG
jgi:hypothetical protein